MLRATAPSSDRPAEPAHRLDRSGKVRADWTCSPDRAASAAPTMEGWIGTQAVDLSPRAWGAVSDSSIGPHRTLDSRPAPLTSPARSRLRREACLECTRARPPQLPRDQPFRLRQSGSSPLTFSPGRCSIIVLPPSLRRRGTTLRTATGGRSGGIRSASRTPGAEAAKLFHPVARHVPP